VGYPPPQITGGGAMSGRAAELIQEIRQITLQYKAEVTGISIHTLLLWKRQTYGGQSFQQLKIIDAAESKAKSELLATAKTNSFATVTVTTPDGFRIEGVPIREALHWIIRSVR
ncbi:MAG TPA: hypothetical protein PLU50_09175, partial [Pseudobdellovibrionaceae bacterium]|nr:hypothetical protein [Pseudobdellovibrionaceae bacterium]